MFIPIYSSTSSVPGFFYCSTSSPTLVISCLIDSSHFFTEMETRKTPNSQPILKKNKAGGITLLMSNYTTKSQKSKLYDTGIKTDI